MVHKTAHLWVRVGGGVRVSVGGGGGRIGSMEGENRLDGGGKIGSMEGEK